MACTLLSDHLKVYVKAGETRLSVLLGHRGDDGAAQRRNSALQTPELSRYELDCILRRESGKPRTEGWAGFLAATPATCANSNIEIA